MSLMIYLVPATQSHLVTLHFRMAAVRVCMERPTASYVRLTSFDQQRITNKSYVVYERLKSSVFKFRLKAWWFGMCCRPIFDGKEFHAAGPANEKREAPFTELQTSRWHFACRTQSEWDAVRQVLKDTLDNDQYLCIVLGNTVWRCQDDALFQWQPIQVTQWRYHVITRTNIWRRRRRTALQRHFVPVVVAWWSTSASRPVRNYSNRVNRWWKLWPDWRLSFYRECVKRFSNFADKSSRHWLPCWCVSSSTAHSPWWLWGREHCRRNRWRHSQHAVWGVCFLSSSGWLWCLATWPPFSTDSTADVWMNIIRGWPRCTAAADQ